MRPDKDTNGRQVTRRPWEGAGLKSVCGAEVNKEMHGKELVWRVFVDHKWTKSFVLKEFV